jgi:hypothetical protein
MNVLFDHNTPRGIARHLVGHKVTEAKERGWDRLTNGDLLSAAEEAGFHLLLTADKNMSYQQNLSGRKIALVVLGNSPWRLVRQHLDAIVATVNEVSPGSYAEVEIPFQRGPLS